MASLFGPSPQEVQQAQLQRQQAEAMQYAQMPQGRGMVAASAGAGQALGRVAGALGGFKDPQMQKAMLMEEAKQEVDASGVDLMNDSQGYYQATAKALAKRGLMDEAMQVRAIAIQEQTSMAEAGYKQAQAAAETTNAGKGVFAQSRNGQVIDTRTGKVVAQGTGPQYAPSEIQKLTAQLEDPSLSPETRTAIEARIAKLNYQQPPASTKVVIEGEKEYNKKMAAGAAARDNKNIDFAQNVDNIMFNVEAITEAVNSPAITGPGADIRLGVAKLLNIAGADNSETIAATQALMSTLAENTLDNIPISNLGGGQGFTEKDKEFLNMAKSGLISFDKNAMLYIAHLQAKGAYNMALQHNQWLKKISPQKRAELEQVTGYPMTPVELPKIPSKPTWNSEKKDTSTVKLPRGWTEAEFNALDEADQKELMRITTSGK